MLSFTSRATIYDVTAYWIIGTVALCIIGGAFYLYWDATETVCWIQRFLRLPWMFSSVLFVVGSYVLGHAVGGMSALTLEHGFRKRWLYDTAADWKPLYTDRNGNLTSRGRVLKSVCEEELHLDWNDLDWSDLAIAIADRLPNCAAKSFYFIAYYGMSRNLAFLFFVSGWLCFFRIRFFDSGVIVAGCLFSWLLSIFFLYNYWRLVHRYYEFATRCLVYIHKNTDDSGMYDAGVHRLIRRFTVGH